MSVTCLLIVPVKIIFPGFVKAELIKLAKMTGIMHEADHALGGYIDQLPMYNP